MKKLLLSILGIFLIASAMGQNVFTVTKTADPDPYTHPFNSDDNQCDPEMYGTLHWAINKVNNASSGSIIEFNIPGAGPHEIALSYTLPQINNIVTIDGATQPGYDPGGPSITISGGTNLGSCFDANTTINIQALHITGFSGHGIIITNGDGSQIKDNIITNIHNEDGAFPATGISLVSSSQCVLQGNTIGTGSNTEIPLQFTDYGICLQNANYCIIGDTIDSFKNIITNCTIGIWVEEGFFNTISGNSIYDNLNASIMISEGGNNNISAPVITEYVDGILKGTSQPGNTIEIFGSTGQENTNQYLVSTTADDNGEWQVNITTNYPYFSATATDFESNTSESGGILENPDYIPYSTKLIDEICYVGEISQDTRLEAVAVDAAQLYLFRIEIIPQDEDPTVYNINSYDKYLRLSELDIFIEDHSICEVSVKPVIENVETHFGETCLFLYKNALPQKTHSDGKIIVRLNSDMDISFCDSMTRHPVNEINSLVSEYGITKINTLFKSMEDSSVHYPNVVHFDSVSQTESLMNDFLALSFVYNVELVPVYSYCVTPNDTYYSSQNLWHLSHINAESAWGIHQDATDVIVAILDNGFNIYHEDLNNNLWVNPGEIPGNGIDDDNNGYTDDVHGYDTGNDDGSPHINTYNSTNQYGHGTHVAGIAGAETNNSAGVASISFGSRLMLVKNSSDIGEFDHERAIASLEYVLENDIDEGVVNMSWGAYDGEYGLTSAQIADLHTVIQNLNNDGILLVAAAGNDGIELGNDIEHYPSGFPEVISVGATQSDDLLAIIAVNNTSLSSNYGTSIDVMAPGVDIMSTMSGLVGSNDVYKSGSGTSMASPLVAGLCALMRSYAPAASVDEIKSCLLSTCYPIDDLNDPEYQGLLGSGRINAFEALKCLMTDDHLAAHFVSSTHKACENEPVTFFDESTGNPVSWEWTTTPSEGVIYSPSNTSQNPDIIFSEPGHYDMTLSVTDINGNERSVTYSDYVFVQNPQVEMVHSNHFCVDDGDVGFCPEGNVTANSLDVCNGSTQTITLYFNHEPPFRAVVTDGYNTYDVSTDYYPCAVFTEYNYMTHVNVVVTEDNNTFTIESFEDNVCALDTYNGAGITFNVHDCCPNLISDGDFEGVTEIPEGRTDLEENTYNNHNKYYLYNTAFSNTYMYIDGPNEDQVHLAGNTDEQLIWASLPVDVTANTDYIFSAENTEGTHCFTNICKSVSGNVLAMSRQRVRLSFKIVNTTTSVILFENVVYFPSNFMGNPSTWMTNNFMWHSVNDQTVRVEIYQVEEFGDSYYDYSLDNIALHAVNTISTEIAGTGITCNGPCDGSATINASGYGGTLEYLWDDPGAQTSQTANSLCVGQYNVTITDDNGCTETDNVTINENLPVTATISSALAGCYGNTSGTATVNPGGGNGSYTYLWSNGQTTQTAIALQAGTYNVTVYDGNMCEAYADVTIDENPAVTASAEIDANVTCYGGSDGQVTVTPGGGTGPYTYLWNDGQETATAYNLSAGTHTVTVYDVYQCEGYASATISEPNELVLNEVTSGHVDIDCYGNATGESEVLATGGSAPYSYSLNGMIPQASGQFTGLTAGTYNLEVTDANNCEAYASVIITEPESLTASLNNTEISCYGETSEITVSATGGTEPYTGTGIFSEIPGTYTYTITDANGCSDNVNVTLTQPTELTVNAGQDITTCGEFKGNIGNPATGGTPPYSYNWTPADNIISTSSPTDYNPYLDIDLPGTYTYTVTVTDSNGCTSTDDITITVNAGPAVSLSATDEVICLGETTELSVDFAGGEIPLEISWLHDPSLHAGSTFVSPTENTSYYVYATGANGCTETDMIEIGVDDIEMTHDINYQYGDEYASVNFYFTPGISGTSYSLTVEDENHTIYTDFNMLPAGHTYTATLITENGCTYTNEFEILYANAYSSSISKVNSITCAAEYNGSVEIEISGGFSPYQVNIHEQGGNYTLNQTINEAGSYVIDLPGLHPTSNNIIIRVTESNGYIETLIIPGFYYAWSNNGLTLTNSNLGNLENITGKVIQLGNAADQSLNIGHDLTFTNCTIYTNTYGTDEDETLWTVNKPYDLILDNTTIESGCPDKMWQGIEAHGTHGDHTTNIQSLVQVKNGSSISDAICAVKSLNGAIVQSYNSSYINNQYDLFFTHYCTKHKLTRIKDNKFLTTNRLKKNGLYPKSHVHMTWVRGIDFRGNQFANTLNPRENQYINQRGIGISSVNSSYIVSPVIGVYCTLVDEPNQFDGLFYGVRARGSYDSPVKIHRSKFKDNFRGVYMSDINSARVLFNTFETTRETPLFEWSGYSLNGTPGTDESYAVYLNACETFFLEENTAVNGDAGFYVYNSGEEPGIFYRNAFGGEPDEGETYNMKAGAIAVGKNSNWDLNNEDEDGRIGLQIRCNNYDATGHAISVINGNIRKNQGAFNGDDKDLAGNQFSESLVNGMDFTSQVQEVNDGAFDFSHLNPGLYNYYQHDDSQSENNGYYRELSGNTSGVLGDTKNGVGFKENESCPSHFSKPLADAEHVTWLLSSIRDNRLEYSRQLDEYKQIVDNGNTEYMKVVAELMDNRNYASAHDILAKEGYLTDTVLTAILCNEIAPGPAIVAILIENLPLPKEVLKLIDNVSLDSNLKELLYLYQAGINKRVALEYAMGDVLQNIAESESQLLNIASNNDSVQLVTDLVARYLDPLASMDYRYSLKKYRLHLAKNDPVSAKAELESLEKLAKEQPDSLAVELAEFIRVEYLSLAYMERYDNSLIEKEKAYLESMAKRESELYSCRAQNLLALTGDYPYYEYTPVPENVSTPRRTEHAGSVRDLFKPGVEVYPNPTDGILTVDYNFETLEQDGMDVLMEVLGYTLNPDCENGIVRIYSPDGQLINTTPLFDLDGQRSIDLSAYPSGVYILEIRDCYGNNNSLKITKQ